MKTTAKVRKLKKTERVVRQLVRELDALADEHDLYRISDSEEAMDWIECLPIANLKESLNKEHGKPREKLSLQDLVQKQVLRKHYDKKAAELYSAVSEAHCAKIDVLIEAVCKI